MRNTGPLGRKERQSPTIAVVGVCSSGKSTLVHGLRRAGYKAYCVAQEHSIVPKLWEHHHPDVLIFLAADQTTLERRTSRQWSDFEYGEQLKRLRDARAHAHLIVSTDHLSPQELIQRVVMWLRKREETDD